MHEDINIIRNEADNIIDVVVDDLWKIIDSSPNLENDLHYEAIYVALLTIMVDAFMRCKILEEPPKDFNPEINAS
jgi:hypothetical protein